MDRKTIRHIVTFDQYVVQRLNHLKYRLNCLEARILKKKGEGCRMTKKIEAKDKSNLGRNKI